MRSLMDRFSRWLRGIHPMALFGAGVVCGAALSFLLPTLAASLARNATRWPTLLAILGAVAAAAGLIYLGAYLIRWRARSQPTGVEARPPSADLEETPEPADQAGTRSAMSQPTQQTPEQGETAAPGTETTSPLEQTPEDLETARGPIAGTLARSSTRPAWKELILLGLLVLAAFTVRAYRLGSFPDTVLADEADNVQDSVRILNGQTPIHGFFGLDWTAQPAFSAYKEAAFIAVFGFNIMAMRLSSAVISTLSLIPFYFLLRRQLSIPSSLLATLLLGTEVWYLNFSRSGWNCSDAAFYMLMAMLFLARGLDAIRSPDLPGWRRWLDFGVAGFFCALGLYGYPAGRAITVAVAAFFPIAWLFNRQQLRPLLIGYAVLFAVEALVFMPQAVTIASDWDHFNGRVGVVSIFNNDEFKADPLGLMRQQVQRNLRAPWDGSVNNSPQYNPVGEPQISRLAGGFALAGMLLTVLWPAIRRRPETWLWWLLLLAGWGATQLFTSGTPNGARGIGYMPTLIYFAGVGIEGGMSLLRYMGTRDGWSLAGQRSAVAIVALMIVGAASSNLFHYVDWQSQPRTREARYLYLTIGEFPDWGAAIRERARDGEGVLTVGQWREMYPIEDRGNPYAAAP